MNELQKKLIAVATLSPRSFAAIVHPYRLILFDSFGVLRNEEGYFSKALATLQTLVQQGKPFLIVTNDASRLPEQHAETLNQAAGCRLIRPEHIISSGMATTIYLRQRFGRERHPVPILCLGTKASGGYIERARCLPFNISEQNVAKHLMNIKGIKAFVLTDDAGFDWEQDLTRLINFLLKHPEIELILSNPDLTFPWRNGEVRIGPGAIAKMIEAAVDRVFTPIGKPHSPIFELALARAEELFGRSFSLSPLCKNEIVMVGDTLETDIAGANQIGIDSAWIVPETSLAQNLLDRTTTKNIQPTHIAHSIWT